MSLTPELASSGTSQKTLQKLPASPRVELRRPMSQGQTWLARLVALTLFVGFWEIGARLGDSLLIPTFTQTMAALFEITFVTGELWPALGLSNVALIIAYPISVAISVPLGLAMARWDGLDRAFSPLTAVGLALPIAPLIPVVLVAMGLGLAPRIFIIILFSWVFIVTNVRAGVRAVDRSQIEMARSFGASERQVWGKILLPAAFPSVMTGLRTGLGRAFAGMIIVELIMLPIGIGAYMLDYRGTFQMDNLYAITIAVAIQGILLALFMQALENRAQRWK